jgi:hypothetical protein
VILGILKLVHILFDLIGIGAGTVVLFGMFAGELLDKWSVIFLKCALAVSVTGLLFPLHHFLPTHWAAMLEIYFSGVAVLRMRQRSCRSPPDPIQNHANAPDLLPCTVP